MPDAAYLSIQGVSKQFDAGSAAVIALENVSFEAQKGAFVSILGPSGCGKSTLFNIVAGLLAPSAGRVLLQGQALPAQAGQVGYMLQKDLLLPWRSIEDNIILAKRLQGVPRRQALAQAAPLIGRCGLTGFEKKRPDQLSGGMRQRAALLRTLLTGRELLLLDEPFGALDAMTRLQLQMILIDVWQALHKTILFVTHDVEEALLLSDEVIVLSRRPGTVRARLTIPLPRPRTPDMLTLPEAVQLKAQLMALLIAEVNNNAEN